MVRGVVPHFLDAIIASSLLFAVCCQSQPLTVGILVDAPDGPEEAAVNLAVQTVNNDTSGKFGKIKLAYSVNYTGLLGAYYSMQHVCTFMKQGIVAVVGPMSSTNVKAAHPLTAGFHIPLIAPVATDPMLDNSDAYPYLLRIFASDKTQSKAIVDFLRRFRFSTMAMLTDNSDYGINGLIEFQTHAASLQWRILSTQQFEATDIPADVEARPQLRNIRSSGSKIVILCCAAQHAVYVLRQAQELGLMESGWLWLTTDGVTAFDLLPNELANGATYLDGIIGTRPVAESGKLYGQFMTAWKANPQTANYTALAFPLAYYDAVLTVALGLGKFQQSTPNFQSQVINCLSSPITPWTQGQDVFKAMQSVSSDGATHKLQFNADGGPVDTQFTYVRLSRDYGWQTIGNWTPTNPDGAMFTDAIALKAVGNNRVLDVRDYVGDIVNQTLRVITIIEPPFVQYAEKKDKCRYKPQCLEGYCIALLDRLADELNFTYTLDIVQDRQYGVYDKDAKQWNGLVKELIPDQFGNVKYDMALGPLTISAAREQVISFTKPYRDLQMAILVGYQDITEYNPFSFLVPFEAELWAYIILTAFAIGIFLAIVDKLSPYGHHGKKVQNESEDEFEEMDINEDGTIDEWERRKWIKEKEAMNFHNAIFWSFASFFEQGGEYHPRAWSGRVVAGAWWFGIVIIISTYTANLAAFLTIKTPKDMINSLPELAAQTLVQYTVISNTEIENFFNSHTKTPYKTMDAQMDAWKASKDIVFYVNSSTAFKDIKFYNGSLALITDSTLADYWKGQSCKDMRLIGTGFGNIGYGLGLPINSKYREELSIKILKLREAGFIDQLDYDWITKNSACAGDSQVDSSGGQIELASMLGVFYVIYAGFAVAFVVLIIEWFVSCFGSIDKDHPRKPKSFTEAFRDKCYRLKVDFLENWFPFKLTNSEESLKLFSVKRDIPGVRSNMASRVASPAITRKDTVHPINVPAPVRIE